MGVEGLAYVHLIELIASHCATSSSDVKMDKPETQLFGITPFSTFSTGMN